MDEHGTDLQVMGHAKRDVPPPRVRLRPGRGGTEFLGELDITPEEREKITHRNAEHLFRLNGG
jgi:hypothetical protein